MLDDTDICCLERFILYITIQFHLIQRKCESTGCEPRFDIEYETPQNIDELKFSH